MEKTEKPLSELHEADIFRLCNSLLFGRDTYPSQPWFSRRVLDAMVAKGYGYQIRKDSKTSEIAEVGVLFRLGPGVWNSESESLDRAICEAAIEALRQENRNG